MGGAPTKACSCDFTGLSGVGVAMLSGKEVQAIPFGEPCSGTTHEIQILAGLLLPKELQASLGPAPQTLFFIKCHLFFPFIKQVYVLTNPGSPPQAGGRAQLELHGRVAPVGLRDGLCPSVVWFQPIKRTLEVTECSF